MKLEINLADPGTKSEAPGFTVTFSSLMEEELMFMLLQHNPTAGSIRNEYSEGFGMEFEDRERRKRHDKFTADSYSLLEQQLQQLGIDTDDYDAYAASKAGAQA